MQPIDSQLPSAARPAAKPAASASANETLSRAARLREARDRLRALLLDEELLVGEVQEKLDALVLELDRLAGMQELYEMWITA